ncbi:MAG: hypothetical protein OQJ77_06350, partial [Thiovulaceae bacterium]|nr:hypothetical protein [Sulfurimonadaceae bacterium]
MQFYFIRIFFISLVTLFIFAGCSEGDIKYNNPSDTNTTTPDDNTTTPDDNTTDNTVTGQFVDAVVEGFDYYCSSGLSGSTNIDGNFTCNTNDSVVFELGGHVFGMLSATETVFTPYSLFPSSLDSALNLSRLLQSIDSDGNVSNSIISIDKTLEALLPSSLDYADSNFTAVVENALSITLIDANEAQQRMNASIVAAGGTISTEQILPVADAGADQNVTVGSF